MVKYLSLWSGIEVVITGLTRNQLYLRVPWVRIPPAPPRVIGMWLSLVERCVRDAEAAGSNPVIPTIPSVLAGLERFCTTLGFLLPIWHNHEYKHPSKRLQLTYLNANCSLLLLFSSFCKPFLRNGLVDLSCTGNG